jgi:hypothetical protein
MVYHQQLPHRQSTDSNHEPRQIGCRENSEPYTHPDHWGVSDAMSYPIFAQPRKDVRTNSVPFKVTTTRVILSKPKLFNLKRPGARTVVRILPSETTSTKESFPEQYPPYCAEVQDIYEP